MRFFEDQIKLEQNKNIQLIFKVDDDKTVTSTVKCTDKNHNTQILLEGVEGNFVIQLGISNSISRVEVFSSVLYTQNSNSSGITVDFDPAVLKSEFEYPNQIQNQDENDDDNGEAGELKDYEILFFCKT